MSLSRTRTQNAPQESGITPRRNGVAPVPAASEKGLMISGSKGDLLVRSERSQLAAMGLI
jgi:hypothetical protein